MLSLSDDDHSQARRLSLHYLETRADPENSSPSLVYQFSHRLALVQFWEVLPGSRVLEIGCGQGDTTIVLANAVGPDGHVDAIDPGDPDYGAPHTLSASQSFISASPSGNVITFHNTNPQSYLASYDGSPYDYVVFSHCTYYFSSPSILASIITSLSGKTNRICIAEWALRSLRSDGQAHLLAALLLASLESKRGVESSENVRCVRSPRAMEGVLAAQGWKLRKTVVRESGQGLLDGKWEVDALIRGRERLLDEMDMCQVSEKEKAAIEAGFDAVEACMESYEGGIEGVRCMDHWVAAFEMV